MHKITIYIIAFYLIAIPYLRIPGLRFLDSKRIVELALLTVIGGIILFCLFYKNQNRIKFEKIYPSKSVSVGFFVFITSGLIAVLLSEYIGYALLEYSFTFLLLSLLFLILPSTRNEHYFLGKIIFYAAVFYSAVYLVIFMGNYITSFIDPMIVLWPEKLTFTIVYEGVEYKGRDILYFSHKRMFNHTQTWTLPILIALLTFFQKKKVDRSIFIFLILFVSAWWMLVFASGARGTIFSTVVTLIFLIILWRRDMAGIVKNGFYSFTLGSIMYFLFYKIIPSVSTGTPVLRGSDSGRLSMWEKAFELWIENPFFGIGPMHYAVFGNEPYFATPHNFYFQILSEWGIFAFLALIVLIFVMFKFILKSYNNIHRNEPNTAIFIGLTWSFFAALTHSFFSGVLSTPMSQLWFVLIGAWLIGYSRFRIRDTYPVKIEKKYFGIIYLLLLSIVLLLTYDDIFLLSEGYYEYMEAYPDGQLYPRFWDQGLIPN